MNIRTVIPVLLFALAAAACGTDDAAEPTTAPSTEADVSPLDTTPAGTGSDRIPLVVDYSPTSSDVAALMYVTQHPDADLLAVTLAGTGESHCEEGVANTRALLAAVGRADTPVACGQERPVGAGNEWPAEWRDAADRLDGLDLPPTAAADGSDDAADLLASTAAANSPVTILALGPLTNLAVATQRHPEFTQHVVGVVTMGGAVGVDGNAENGAAEWNYYIDPTSVDVVLRSGLPVTMVPLDATNHVPVTNAWFAALTGHRTTIAANVVHDLFAASRPWEFGFFFWDELAAAVAFDDRAATFEEHPIAIELAGPEQGRTRIDTTGTSVRVAVGADADRFTRDLLTTLNDGTEPPELSTTTADIEYFQAVEASVATLGAAIEQLFLTPLAQEAEAIADRGDAVPLEPGDEATLREYFTTFWTDGFAHLAVFLGELERLDPPAAVSAEHGDYVTAVEAIIDDSERRLTDIQTRDSTELPEMLWEPDPLLDAMTTACEALGTAATGLGVNAETCP
ncbi:MAG: nucleoside hydrolase [Ilumatobacteraceae bacterium]